MQAISTDDIKRGAWACGKPENVRRVRIPKSKNRYRDIYIPQGLILPGFLKRMMVPVTNIMKEVCDRSVVHGFWPGRSPVSNAYQHTGYEWTMSLDLQDFFDTVTTSMVASELILKEYVNSEDGRYILSGNLPFSHSVMYKGIARQGFCTSPPIANIAAVPFDAMLKESAKAQGVMYTRYADDLTLSGNSREAVESVAADAVKFAECCEFAINTKKTKIQWARHGRRIITGVGVDDDVHPTRKVKRKLRAARHQRNRASSHGLEEWCKTKLPSDWHRQRRLDEEYWGREGEDAGIKF